MSNEICLPHNSVLNSCASASIPLRHAINSEKHTRSFVKAHLNLSLMRVGPEVGSCTNTCSQGVIQQTDVMEADASIETSACTYRLLHSRDTPKKSPPMACSPLSANRSCNTFRQRPMRNGNAECATRLPEPALEPCCVPRQALHGDAMMHDGVHDRQPQPEHSERLEAEHHITFVSVCYTLLLAALRNSVTFGWFPVLCEIVCVRCQ